MSLHPAKTNLARLEKLRLLLFAAILVAPCLCFTTQAQQITTSEIVFPVTIQWNREKCVKRYRLQIAADERFQNVFLDRPVIGDRFVVSELSAGYYYWRVAPADSQLGNFSRPVRFFISGGMVMPVHLPVVQPGRTRRRL
ncbi:MAG: hypothetical protein ACRD9S_23475 [Pyrinomonadaceae bacterium]